MSLLFELFITFMRIGLFTFGGGYAMISIIEDICVTKNKWISHEDMMNITVIAESTPGPVAINCATFVGYKQKKFIGALVATLGMVLPSFIVIVLISSILDNYLKITIVANAFKGIKLAVGILILDASLKMLKKMKKKPMPCAFMICSAIMMLLINLFSLNFSSIGIMFLFGVLSLFLLFVTEHTKKKEGN